MPQSVRGWGEFLDVFGGFVPYSYLPDSVYAFFANGGEKCYVVRVAAVGVPSVTGQCRTVIEPLRKARGRLWDAAGNTALVVEAINEGRWGNDVTIEIGRGSRRIALARSTAEAGGLDKQIAVDFVHNFAPDDVIWIARRDGIAPISSYTVSSVSPVDSTISLVEELGAVVTEDTEISGYGFRVTVRYEDRTEIFDDLSMDRASKSYFARHVIGDPDLVDYVAKDRSGASILISMSAMSEASSKPASALCRLRRGGDGAKFAHAGLGDDDDGPESQEPVVAVARASGQRGNNLRVSLKPFAGRTALDTPAGKDVIVEEIKAFVGCEGQTLLIAGAPGGPEQAEIDEIRVADNRIVLRQPLAQPREIGSELSIQDADGRYGFDVAVGGDWTDEPLERFSNLTLDATASRHFLSVVNQGHALSGQTRSAYIRLCLARPVSGELKQQDSLALQGGSYPSEIDYRLYTGYAQDGSYFSPMPAAQKARIGLSSLESLDELSLLAMPDLPWIRPNRSDEAVAAEELAESQAQLLSHCRKAGDRLALIDGPPGQDPEEIEVWRSRISDSETASFGALYYPWLKCVFAGEPRVVPPCGFIAGLFAFCDRHYGLNRAPAYTTVEAAVDVEVDVTRAHQELLNPVGVNCIRKRGDGAVKIWGMRTLSVDPRRQHLSSRRVLLSVVKQLTRNLRWTVFEPNDRFLRQRIEAALISYFQSLVSKGMTAGENAQDAFQVRCDDETNDKEGAIAGMVVAEVGLALSDPAEFIRVTVKRTSQSLEIAEANGG